LNDVPTSGGAVYFPPGDYLVSGPLAPKSRTLISGSHIPRWQGLVNPEFACKIRMSGGFTGTGLIVPAGSTVAVKLRNLALVGNDVSSGLHGLRMPDTSAAAGEGSWELEDVTIAGFSGDGIYGRVHVAILIHCFIHNNQGWGSMLRAATAGTTLTWRTAPCTTTRRETCTSAAARYPRE